MSAAVHSTKEPRGSERPRAVLRGLPTPSDARLGNVGFVVVLVAILVAGMAGLLTLNTQIQDRAFAVNELAHEAQVSGDQQARLQSEVEDASSPSSLQERANQLGMVPDPGVGYVLLGPGKVTGTPKPITGSELPRVQTPAQQEAAAKAQAAAAQAKADAEAKAKADADAKAKADAAAKASASPSPKPDAAPSPGGH